MEDTLRDVMNIKKIKEFSGLNPCFNGRYSQRIDSVIENTDEDGLNPCFNGRYSQSAKTYVPLYTSIWGYVQAFRNAFVNTN